MAHSPLMDADLSDWCVGAFTNTAPGGGRIEDTSTTLTCGNCSITTDLACQVASDCPGGESCINLTSKVEMVWWDNRTDGAVNDLGTVVTTTDNNNLYFAAELWVDPDPLSLPFGQIAIDFTPGGRGNWHDPLGVLTNSGRCSVSDDRACTKDADCHFCAVSNEPFPSQRLRTCGSGCNPDDENDICLMSETCTDVGTLGATPNVGLNTTPASLPDHLLLFDFSRWLAGLDDATALMRQGAQGWEIQGLVLPAVNPGASGGSGGPPGSVEVAIPWSMFGCTGCPDACVCPGFGPGQDYKFTMIIARGESAIDYIPRGAIEDTLSECPAGRTSRTTDSCPGFGIGNTLCEIGDGSVDTFVPDVLSDDPGGRSSMLVVDKNTAPSITLNWCQSCSRVDGDYGVYEGLIGTWYSHVPVPLLCSTGGATTATFNAGAGDRYYIVVPSDGSTEGSYCLDDLPGLLPAERPASTAPCTGQLLGTCP
jgi:hypothetical protein